MIASTRLYDFLLTLFLGALFLYFYASIGIQTIVSVTANHNSFQGLLVASEIDSDIPRRGSQRWYVHEIFWNAATNTNCTLRREQEFYSKSDAVNFHSSIKLGTTRRIWMYENTSPVYCYDRGIRRNMIREGMIPFVFFFLFLLLLLHNWWYLWKYPMERMIRRIPLSYRQTVPRKGRQPEYSPLRQQHESSQV